MFSVVSQDICVRSGQSGNLNYTDISLASYYSWGQLTDFFKSVSSSEKELITKLLTLSSITTGLFIVIAV